MFRRNLYESFAKGDIPAVLGSFDPNIKWIAAENSPYTAANPMSAPPQSSKM